MTIEEDLSKVISRISALETHIINLIIPIQAIANVMRTPEYFQQVQNIMSQPLQIDDRNLSIILQNFKEVRKDLHEDIKDFDLTQTLSEIKYIGNRLKGIEKDISDIKESGVEKKISVDLTLDGYKMERKKTIYEDAEEKVNPDHFIKELLDTLLPREAEVIKHRIGLLGCPSETFKVIGTQYGLSVTRVREIYLKGMRKCRHPSRNKYVDKISNENFIKAIRKQT